MGGKLPGVEANAKTPLLEHARRGESHHPRAQHGDARAPRGEPARESAASMALPQDSV